MSSAIGVDLGGTNIKLGLVQRGGTILHEATVPTEAFSGRDRVLQNLLAGINDLVEVANKTQRTVDGIGIGAPGIIDHGVVTACGGNLPELEGFSLGQWVHEKFGSRVWLDNDANMMGLAEFRYGEAKSVENAVFITIGTGIGGALLLNGRLYRGHGNRGGELGHIMVAGEEFKCTCGATGCLEAVASVPALLEDYRRELTRDGKTPDANLDGRIITQRYLEGEPAATRAMKRHFNYMARGIASLINIFSPQKIILGGGITEAGSFYVQGIEEVARRLVMEETGRDTRIVTAKLGNKAGFLGAAIMAIDAANTCL